MSLVAFALVAEAGDADLSAAERAVFDEALEAAAKKDWAMCRTRAAGVWDTNKSPTVAALLGACEAELGMHREAAEHLDFFLERDDGKTPKQTASAQKRFPTVRAKVMLVELATQPVADVRVDGNVIGKTPLRLWLEPGPHKIEISQLGFISKTESVTATAGGSQKLELKLEAEAATTNATGGAGVGASHQGAGGGPGETPEPSDEKSIPLLVVGGILAAGGLIAGSVMLGVGIQAGNESSDKRRELGGANPCGEGTPHVGTCSEIADLDGRYTSLTIGGGIALGAGAAVGIATLVYALVPEGADPSPAKSESVSVVPVLAPDRAGVVVGGRF